MTSYELYTDFDSEDEVIEHIGVKRRSGRYDWGSGEIPYQHEPWFTWTLGIDNLRAQGLTETEVAAALGMTTGEYRNQNTLYAAQRKAAESAFAYRLKEHGYSNTSIANRMNISEGKVRNMLKEHYQVRNKKLDNIKGVLTDAVQKHGYIDVGDGTELYMNIKKTQLQAALTDLQNNGYALENLYFEQTTNPNKKTTVKVLAPPGTTKNDMYNNADKISFVGERLSEDGLERTRLGLMRPKSLDSSRLEIRYAEDGGVLKDGVIELRRGVEDVSLGGSRYAQVRIAVDDKYYLKGMAVYTDDLPPGIDVRFNTNKKTGAPIDKVLKPLKTTNEKDPDAPIDWDNPFGSTIKDSVKNEQGLLIGGQREYVDANGKKQLSLINKVNDEGDWGEWKKTIASQVLSKQSESLAKDQLNIAYLERRTDLDGILKLTNSEVKKNLLQSFADDCDSAASDLKGAALPRQSSKVILPLTSIKDNEIFAPSYRDGETVVLIRYPHGGKFEIPELVVNNKNKEGRSSIGLDAKDAVGISVKTAAKLSGADFDGDTVLVIPNNNGRMQAAPVLRQLKNFDPKEAYPEYPGMRKLTEGEKQKEMGKVTNLITDMTIKGATPDEIARAVKHSMVIIDAVKHKLNYKQSEIDNGIAALKLKYQGGEDKGASTLISRASSEARVNERYERYKIDPKTGERIFQETGRTFEKVQRYTSDSKKLGPDGKPLHKKGDIRFDENGNAITKTVKYQTVTTKMDLVKDASVLSSGTKMEQIYADYANNLKGMANEARKALIATKTYDRSSEAAKAYAPEVASLEAKLEIAKKNRPLERKATIIADLVVKAKIADNPSLRSKENAGQLKKVRQAAITEARRRMGTTKRSEREIDITPKEWEAIQARAISPTKLRDILSNTNLDVVRSYATPKEERKGLTTTQIALAKSLIRSGNSVGDIADRFGVSTTTIYDSIG